MSTEGVDARRPSGLDTAPRPRAAVTGASSGIGAAFARALACDGAELVLVARDRAALEALADDLPGRHEVVVADLADAGDLARVEAVLRERPVELLVNNAATARWGPFLEQDPEDLTTTIGVNVLATARLARAVLPAMVEAGHGGVISVSSPAGERPAPMLAAYGSSKAFLDALDTSLRAELGDSPVTLTTVRPGWIRTGFHARIGQDVGAIDDAAWATPEEVAREALHRHRRGDTSVRVPQPGARQRLVDAARARRRRLPDPVKRLVRTLRRR
jgi:uncharacterized protein